MDIDKRGVGFPLLSIFTSLQILTIFDGFVYLSYFDNWIEFLLGILLLFYGAQAAITTYALFRGELWAPKSILTLYLIGLVTIVIAFGADEDITFEYFTLGLGFYLLLASSMVAYVFWLTPRYSNK
ncbi:MAG: hypothetical protein HUJ29_10740 [Gammaproteobacteria bacterium]|nr:hypothetical protein [Gammaproteobacteria bacterium]